MISFNEWLTEKTNLKFPKNKKNKINVDLSSQKIGNYFTSIPFKTIEDILNKYNLLMVDKDGSEYESIVNGKLGRLMIDIADKSSEYDGLYSPFEDSILNISYEKMNDGKYEVNCYIS